MPHRVSLCGHIPDQECRVLALQRQCLFDISELVRDSGQQRLCPTSLTLFWRVCNGIVEEVPNQIHREGLEPRTIPDSPLEQFQHPLVADTLMKQLAGRVQRNRNPLVVQCLAREQPVVVLLGGRRACARIPG